MDHRHSNFFIIPALDLIFFYLSGTVRERKQKNIKSRGRVILSQNRVNARKII